MNSGIIRNALATTLILELEYREPSIVREIGTKSEMPAGWTGVVTKLMQQSGEFGERKKTEPAVATAAAD